MGFWSRLFGTAQKRTPAEKQESTATAVKAVAPTDPPAPEGMAKCATCQGKGKVFSSANMRTGEITYRPCGVCHGTGWVPEEMKHWSTDVSVSSNIARQLIYEHGKPAEAVVEADSSQHHAVTVRMLFNDGYQCLLGGYAAGYSGTHPDYLRRTLQAAGFEVSSDDVENMNLKSLPVRFTKDK